jgi:competence protein ComEC
MQIALDSSVTATLLSPGSATISASIDQPNNHSIVLYLRLGRISFLLPGDIEAPVEHNLVLNQTALAATVLKSPHHGSKTSSSETFLAVVNPQVVVISVGPDNQFGHPSPEVLERYTEHGIVVFRTDEHGTIEFSTDGEQLWVETDR